MEESNKKEIKTVCEKIVKSFLEQLAESKDYEEIAVRLAEALLDVKPTDAVIRAALFDEEPS